jgi:hypothetical protein
MKEIAITIFALLLFGCSPIRYSYDCEVPSFVIESPSIVNETFPTNSFFKSSCKVKTARNFTILTKVKGVAVDVRQEAFRPTLYMKPRSDTGERIVITGQGIFETAPVHSYAIDIDLSAKHSVSFDVRDSNNKTIDSITLSYAPITCNCVGYDAP